MCRSRACGYQSISTDTPGVAEETNPDAIERWGRVPVLCLVPNEPMISPQLPEGIRAAIDQVNWMNLTTGQRS